MSTNRRLLLQLPVEMYYYFCCCRCCCYIHWIGVHACCNYISAATATVAVAAVAVAIVVVAVMVLCIYCCCYTIFPFVLQCFEVSRARLHHNSRLFFVWQSCIIFRFCFIFVLFVLSFKRNSFVFCFVRCYCVFFLLSAYIAIVINYWWSWNYHSIRVGKWNFFLRFFLYFFSLWKRIVTTQNVLIWILSAAFQFEKKIIINKKIIKTSNFKIMKIL